jgi:hypothetical protein
MVSQEALSDDGVACGASVHQVDVRKLRFGLSPRFSEQDLEHASLLTHSLEQCPPILVEPRTHSVIDGVHRVLAARMLGWSHISARYFDGTPEEAFLVSVRANISHGKPLTLAEREFAAKTVLRVKCEWSDRRVADACGLSGKTVAKLRQSTAEIPQFSTRIGMDGRRRSVPSVATPDRDVSRGSLFRTETDPKHAPNKPDGSPETRRQPLSAGTGRPHGPQTEWASDNAIASMTNGKEIAEWLDRTIVNESTWSHWLDDLPLSRIPELIQHGRDRSKEWHLFADALEARLRAKNRRSRR